MNDQVTLSPITLDRIREIIAIKNAERVPNEGEWTPDDVVAVAVYHWAETIKARVREAKRAG